MKCAGPVCRLAVQPAAWRVRLAYGLCRIRRIEERRAALPLRCGCVVAALLSCRRFAGDPEPSPRKRASPRAVLKNPLILSGIIRPTRFCVPPTCVRLPPGCQRVERSHPMPNDFPEPQAVCNPITRSAIFIVATLTPGDDSRRHRARVVPRHRRAGSRGRHARADRRPVVCLRVRLRRVGHAFRRAAPGVAAPVSRIRRRQTPRRRHARRHPAAHSRGSYGPLLRTRRVIDAAFGRRGHGGRRSARLSLFRSARHGGFRRRHGEPARARSIRFRGDRRAGPRLRGRQLCDRAEVSA